MSGAIRKPSASLDPGIRSIGESPDGRIETDAHAEGRRCLFDAGMDVAVAESAEFLLDERLPHIAFPEKSEPQDPATLDIEINRS